MSEPSSRVKTSVANPEHANQGLVRCQTQSDLSRAGGRRLTSLADARKSVDRRSSRENLLQAKDITEQVAQAMEGWNNIKKKELETIEECRPGKPATNPSASKIKPSPTVQPITKKPQPINPKDLNSKGGLTSPNSKAKPPVVIPSHGMAKKANSSGTGTQASSSSLITKQSALAELAGGAKEFDIDKTFKDLEDLKTKMETIAPQSARPPRGSVGGTQLTNRGQKKISAYDAPAGDEDSSQKQKASEAMAARRAQMQLQRENTNTGGKKLSAGMAGQSGTGKSEAQGENSNLAKKSAMVKNKKCLDEIEGLAQALFSKIGEMQRDNGWSIKIDTLKREYVKTLDTLKGEVIKKS
jgi:hypothetical protein